jgi:hypothetical protein
MLGLGVNFVVLGGCRLGLWKLTYTPMVWRRYSDAKSPRRHKGFAKVAAVRYRDCDESSFRKTRYSGAFFFDSLSSSSCC